MMYRLAALFLLLTFVGAGAAPCLAAGNCVDCGDDSATLTFTTADGVEALALKGSKATIVARSFSLAIADQTMEITPHDKGIQLRFGPHLMRVPDLQFLTMPEIQSLELLRIQAK